MVKKLVRTTSLLVMMGLLHLIVIGVVEIVSPGCHTRDAKEVVAVDVAVEVENVIFEVWRM